MTDNNNEIDLDISRSKRLSVLYSGVLADVMDDMGLRKQVLGSHFRPLFPDMTLAGPAYPVRGRARVAESGDDPRYMQIKMIENIRRGSVVVVDPGGEKHAAHWGELMSRASRAQGAVGAVVAGNVRDCNLIREVGFPVFHTKFSPLTAVWRFETTDFLIPITIDDVVISPGDFLHGDYDGVLVIPRTAIDEVLSTAEELKSKEKLMQKGLAEGRTIRELFEKYKAF